jgi:hypothetical protein
MKKFLKHVVLLLENFFVLNILKKNLLVISMRLNMIQFLENKLQKLQENICQNIRNLNKF